MNERPFLIALYPDGYWLHLAMAGRLPVAGTIVYMTAPETHGAVVSVITAECCIADDLLAVNAAEFRVCMSVFRAMANTTIVGVF